jgi:hypothetical protein
MHWSFEFGLIMIACIQFIPTLPPPPPPQSCRLRIATVTGVMCSAPLPLPPARTSPSNSFSGSIGWLWTSGRIAACVLARLALLFARAGPWPGPAHALGGQTEELHDEPIHAPSLRSRLLQCMAKPSKSIHAEPWSTTPGGVRKHPRWTRLPAGRLQADNSQDPVWIGGGQARERASPTRSEGAGQGRCWESWAAAHSLPYLMFLNSLRL